MSKWLAVSLSLSLIAGAFFVLRPARPDRAKHLINRVWIERMPRGDRDMVHSFVAVSAEGERVGAFSHASRWRARAELFRHRLAGGELTMVFPQAKRRVKAQVRTWECEGKAPPPFELCLAIKDGDRTMKLYSRHDWKLPVDDAATAAPVMLPGLAGAPALDEAIAPFDGPADGALWGLVQP